jgi:hypothetical protein
VIGAPSRKFILPSVPIPPKTPEKDRWQANRFRPEITGKIAWRVAWQKKDGVRSETHSCRVRNSEYNGHVTKRTDADLLWEFASRGNEAAFAELVQRHIHVVYSAACRETADDLPAAADATRLVFAELARKAGSLQRQDTLAGWLYTHVRRVIAEGRRCDPNRSVKSRVIGELSTQRSDAHEETRDLDNFRHARGHSRATF